MMGKKILAALLTVAMAAELAACSGGGAVSSAGTASEGGSAAASASTEKVKIQFMHQQVEQERQTVVQGIIQSFEKENPNIEVESIPVNEDNLDSKITALGGSGKLPAVMELSQDQAKTNAKNKFTDTDAVDQIIQQKGEDKFYSGTLKVIKTEDGKNYVGVPLCGWVQGIWVNNSMLKAKGLSAPKTWDDVVSIAKAFYQPSSKQYGIAIPTGENAFTEQVFSQFALSNGANVFDTNGNVTFDSPLMKEAVQYYKRLAAYSMPGSTEVADVKDAFVGKKAPMALYSTYILSAVEEAGFLSDLSLVLPQKTTSAAYGCVIALSISSGLSDVEQQAAEKFVSYMLEDENNIKWILMAPGGVQPVLKSVSEDTAYLNNDKIKALSHLSNDISTAFTNLQVFGTVGDKNFMAMGDITNKKVIGKVLNDVIVHNADIDSELAGAKQSIEEIAK